MPGAQQTAVATYNSFIAAIKLGPQPTGSGYCSLGCPSLSEQDYLDLVVKPDTLKTRITDKLGESISKTQEEVHAAHILVADQKTAQDIEAQLAKGANFADLAAKYSTDTSNKDQGGDLGWFAPTEKGGPMVQEFSDAAFKLTKPGQISDPVQSQFGWHIIKLIERGPRPLSDSELSTAKSTAFDDWLKSEKAKTTYTINVPPTATPVPTSPPLPTLPLAGTPTTASLTPSGAGVLTPTVPGGAPAAGNTPTAPAVTPPSGTTPAAPATTSPAGDTPTVPAAETPSPTP